MCNHQIQLFLDICGEINFPVSMEKMIWGETWVIFLGLLIDGKCRLICIPQEKISRALELIQGLLNKKSWKATVKQIQQLCGYLNFLCKNILPGRAFTRRLYAITGGD